MTNLNRSRTFQIVQKRFQVGFLNFVGHQTEKKESSVHKSLGRVFHDEPLWPITLLYVVLFSVVHVLYSLHVRAFQTSTPYFYVLSTYRIFRF